MRLIPLILAACFAVTPAHALDSSAGKLTVTKMVDQLNDPWAIGFLPDDSLLITEKGGLARFHVPVTELTPKEPIQSPGGIGEAISLKSCVDFGYSLI